jgi:hypothetical protein
VLVVAGWVVETDGTYVQKNGLTFSQSQESVRSDLKSTTRPRSACAGRIVVARRWLTLRSSAPNATPAKRTDPKTPAAIDRFHFPLFIATSFPFPLLRFAQLTSGSARRVPFHNALKRRGLRPHKTLILGARFFAARKVIAVTPLSRCDRASIVFLFRFGEERGDLQRVVVQVLTVDVGEERNG